MRHVLVASDFSARSDRAVRRAILLARTHGASVTIVHAVDDDQPRRIVDAEREAAAALLREQARSLQETDRVECGYRVLLGNAFETIVKAAEEIDCDLLVLGPHRRQALKDVFVGTTAERTIRASSRPVVMANGVPAGPYRHVLVAVDFSECSADAVRAVSGLRLEKHAAVAVLHVADAPGARLMSRAALTEGQVQDYLHDVEERASGELDAFLGSLRFDPTRRIVKHGAAPVAATISEVARQISADLIVVGTHGHTGITKLLLGSVAEEILRTGECDVLAVPPRAAGNDDNAQTA